jgi:hypothetical protein
MGVDLVVSGGGSNNSDFIGEKGLYPRLFMKPFVYTPVCTPVKAWQSIALVSPYYCVTD